MKYLNQRYILIIGTCCLLLTCGGIGNQASSPFSTSASPNRALAKPGGFQLLIHDAPPAGNIEAIYVTVVSVDLVSMDGRILNVSDMTKTFNLLDYTSGNPLELVNKVIPSGRYSQIRLKFSEDHTIKVSGVIKPLKTPSAEQSGLKLSGYFEITEGLLYSMNLHFDPNKSVVYNPGPDRYILKPVIEIVSNSLVDGPFIVNGLIEGETAVAELLPNGTLRLLSSFDPRVELNGTYFFSYGTKTLHLELASVICPTCTNATSIPGSIFHSFPNSDITVSRWDTTSIVGSVGSGLLSRLVTFTKTNSFAIDASTGYTVLNVLATYPVGHDGKFGILSLVPETVAGRTFADIQQIQNQTATFVFKIPYKELPGGIPGGSKNFRATLKIAANLTDMKMNALVNGAICGTVEIAATNYVLNVPVADKILKTDLAFNAGAN